MLIIFQVVFLQERNFHFHKKFIMKDFYAEFIRLKSTTVSDQSRGTAIRELSQKHTKNSEKKRYATHTIKYL